MADETNDDEIVKLSLSSLSKRCVNIFLGQERLRLLKLARAAFNTATFDMWRLIDTEASAAAWASSLYVLSDKPNIQSVYGKHTAKVHRGRIAEASLHVLLRDEADMPSLGLVAGRVRQQPPSGLSLDQRRRLSSFLTQREQDAHYSIVVSSTEEITTDGQPATSEKLGRGEADKSSNGQKPRKSISREDAEVVARRLDKGDVTFAYLIAVDMAKRIQQESGKPCSATLVKGLPFWKEAMQRTGRGRERKEAKGRGRKRGTLRRPVNFSKELEAATGEGRNHEVLEVMAEAEERAYAEKAKKDQAQAIAHVRHSHLSDEAKQQTIDKVEAGEMTPDQAIQMVSLYRNDSKGKPQEVC